MDVIVRSAAIFLLLFVAVRASGKRQIAELSAFDFILLVTIGDLVSQSVVQEDYSVTAGALAVATFTLLSVFTSLISWRFPRTQPFLEGQPIVFLRDGELDMEVLRYERVPVDDIHEAARQQGITDLATVDLGVLETDGNLSFLRRQGDSG